jgi:hypothetical protein
MVRSTGGFDVIILTGESRRGMSKNEGAFSDLCLESGVSSRLSRSMRSGVPSLCCGFDFGEGYSCVSDLIGIRSGRGRVLILGGDANWERLPWLKLNP